MPCCTISMRFLDIALSPSGFSPKISVNAGLRRRKKKHLIMI